MCVCIGDHRQPSVDGYFQWVSTITDPVYMFTSELVYTYVLAIYLFRSGVRRNNSDAIIAGRVKYAHCTMA
jgi:hypothetical protein